MYSLTIHFGPNAICWAFLLKEKENAEKCYGIAVACINDDTGFIVLDDFGQRGVFKAGAVHGALLEDLDLVERARIERSLAEERCKVKLMAAAKTDPVIGAAIRQQQTNPGVLTPFPRQ